MFSGNSRNFIFVQKHRDRSDKSVRDDDNIKETHGDEI